MEETRIIIRDDTGLSELGDIFYGLEFPDGSERYKDQPFKIIRQSTRKEYEECWPKDEKWPDEPGFDYFEISTD